MKGRLENLTGDLIAAQESLRRDEHLLRLDRGRSSLLQQYLKDRISKSRTQASQIREHGKALRNQFTVHKHLEGEYLRKASATALLFTVASNVQAANNPDDFSDAVSSAVKELVDVDRFQLRQKLEGGNP